MTQWAANFGSDSRYQLNCEAYEVPGSLDAVNNRSQVRYRRWVERNYSTGGYFTGNGDATSGGNIASGNWSPYDFRGGVTVVPIVDTTFWVTHNPDGSGSITITAYATDPNNLGSASIGSQTLGLTTLTVPPGAPTGLTCSYVSDTSANLNWANNAASNGAPTQNKIQASVNNGAFADLVTIGAATGAAVAVAANRKTVFQVNASNGAGASGYSNLATLFTTPAAPTGVAAAKDSSLNAIVTWTPQVGFSEHEHVVRHGTTTDGGATVAWDGSPVGVVPAGTATFTHVAPSPSAVHVYAVFARNTDTGARQSAQVQSNTVALLTAPNKPTLPAIGPYQDKAKDFTLPWTHNSVDTTPQSAYEVGYSLNGGTTWASTGKVTSATPSKLFAANSYTSGQQLTLRVRTWGSATAGGSDGTGASAWSDLATVTFKTRPTLTIVSPASSGSYPKAALEVQLTFAQAEGATFVSATIELYQGTTLLESRVTTTLASTTLATRVANSSAYSAKVVVLDSNGLVSDVSTRNFTVAYTAPVAPIFSATYLSESGIGQLGIAIPEPGAGEAAAETINVTRSIGGVVETVVENYPASPLLTILDTTPTIRGDNVYTVTTVSVDGATALASQTMTTAEDEWAFMSKGPGFSEIVRFGGELKPQASPSVDSTLVKTAGRARPIGLYGKTGDLVISGTGEVVNGLGSSPEEIEEFLLVSGKGCYRDPTGRRIFGRIAGQISRDSYMLSSFTYSVTETS